MLYNPTYWHWLILACALLGLEILVPGAFFLWLGLAALASAILHFFLPSIGPEVQYAMFAVFCILSLFGWKKFTKEASLDKTDKPTLNQRNQQYLGRTLVLSEAIVNGFGKVTVDDSKWKVTGNDMAAGSKVKVTHVDGSILRVEAI